MSQAPIIHFSFICYSNPPVRLRTLFVYSYKGRPCFILTLATIIILTETYCLWIYLIHCQQTLDSEPIKPTKIKTFGISLTSHLIWTDWIFQPQEVVNIRQVSNQYNTNILIIFRKQLFYFIGKVKSHRNVVDNPLILK